MDKLHNCVQGQHQLKTILRAGPSCEQHVVRWCETCGSIVIDMDFDNRTNAGYFMKMKSPEISKV
jgi:hypothetical protein